VNASHPSSRSPKRPGAQRRRGQSIVEYALTLALLFLLTRGTIGTVFNSFVSVVETVRSGIEGTDTIANGHGGQGQGQGQGQATPTPRLPPPPATPTALPAQPTVERQCSVPNLIGIDYTSARDILWQREGFTAGNLTKPNGSKSTFIIGQQSLAAGTLVTCTSTMHVEVKICTVPSMVNKTWGEAQTAWSAAGFLASALQRPEGSSTTFTVGAQSMNSGAKSDGCDSDVMLTPKQCLVPNLANKSFDGSPLSQAHNAWMNAGFSAGRLSAAAGSPSSFTVGFQSLAANTQTDCEAAMEAAPNMCQVPSMVGLSSSAAQSAWTGNNFTAGNLTRPAGVPGTLEFSVISQSVAAGTTLPCATSQVEISPAMCTVPNMTGLAMSTSGGSAAQSIWTVSGFAGTNLKWPAGAPSSFSVVNQSVAAGTSIACAQEVTVEPAMCQVPNLNGRTFNTSGTGNGNADWNNRQFTGSLSAPGFTPNSFTVTTQSLPANSWAACAAPMSVEPAMCTVPDMARMIYDDVDGSNHIFRRAGFSSSTLKRDFNNDDRRIGYTVPAAGERVACSGYNVTAYEAMCTVPDMDGQMYDDVDGIGEAFRNAGFTLDLGRNFSGNRRVGATVPAAGTEQLCSTPVQAQEKLCTVPNLKGQSTDSALAANGVWRANGFTSTLNRVNSTSTSQTIGWQEYAPGAQLACSTSINVARVCQVPALAANGVNRTYSQYRDAWTGAGFTSGNNVQKHNPSNLNNNATLRWLEFAAGTPLFCDGKMRVSTNSGTTQPGSPPSPSLLPAEKN
jgi:beta-lactam-binding protein with PASTA domain